MSFSGHAPLIFIIIIAFRIIRTLFFILRKDVHKLCLSINLNISDLNVIVFKTKTMYDKIFSRACHITHGMIKHYFCLLLIIDKSSMILIGREASA